MVQGVQELLILPVFVLAVIMTVDGLKVLLAKKKLTSG